MRSRCEFDLSYGRHKGKHGQDNKESDRVSDSINRIAGSELRKNWCQMVSKEQLNRACAFDEVELLRRHILGRVLSIERMRVEFHHTFSSFLYNSCILRVSASLVPWAVQAWYTATLLEICGGEYR
jgi:hypothetical protein